MSWHEETQGAKKGRHGEAGSATDWLGWMWLTCALLRDHSMHDKHPPLLEGLMFSDFYHHLSQKTFLFTNSSEKQALALAHSSLDGFGGRRVKYTPALAVKVREEAVSEALCGDGGGQQGRCCQDLAKCVCVRGTEPLPTGHSCNSAKAWEFTEANSLRMLVVAKASLLSPLSLEPGHLHTGHMPHNDQLSKNSQEVHFSGLHPRNTGHRTCTYIPS